MQNTNKKIADIGCGINKVPGSVGIDSFDSPGVDVVCDLQKFPWPFNDNEFDEVIANHFLEHCFDIIPVISEMHRITKKYTGKIRIRSPHYSSWNFYGDLTHKTPFSLRSFDHFTYEDSTGYNYYSPVKFKIEFKKILFAPPGSKLNFWKFFGIQFLANRFPKIYERIFAFILPCTEVQFILLPIDSDLNYKFKTKATIKPAQKD